MGGVRLAPVRVLSANAERAWSLVNSRRCECDVAILTLGLTEAWRFAHDRTWLSYIPFGTAPELLERHNLTVEENIANLQQLSDHWRAYNPDLKIIVTVSPVPLNATFRHDTHVVVANSYSKSVLRVAAETIAQQNEHVDYFPAFEIVLWGCEEPFLEDMRHPSVAAIDRVMAAFRGAFTRGHTPR